MAPKRPLSDPPPHSSSEDEEQSDTEDEQEPEQMQAQRNGGLEEPEVKSDEEEEGEEDNDNDEEQKPAPKVPALKANLPAGDDFGSETETDSSNSRPSQSASEFNVTLITSKPMNDSTKPRRDSVKRNLNLSPAATPTRSVGSKRANESDVEKKDSKKKKAANGVDEEEAKKNTGFQRVWSEEDEIEILKAMIDYRMKKGSEPNTDMGAFYEFVKKRINVNASKSQVIDKIRRLKKKYQNYADKSVDGKDPILPRPHEYLTYELSKKIWGPNRLENGEKNKKKTGSGGAGQSNKAKNDSSPIRRKDVHANGVVRVKANGDAHAVRHENLDSALLSILASENISSHPEAASSFVRKALPLIDTVKAEEFNQNWKELQKEQFELFVKQTSFILDGAKLVLDAMKSSDN